MDENYAMLQMSDGSRLRVWRLQSSDPNPHGFIMLLGGWGGMICPTDPLARALASDFNVILVHTRETNSSDLSSSSTHDLDRSARDLTEICNHLAIDPSHLLVYAYSWTSILVAQAVVRHGWRPRAIVFGCPVAKLTLPPLTRYLLGLLPAPILRRLKPVAAWWVSRFKARDAEDAAAALAVIAAADLEKWRAVGHDLFAKSYWSLYAALDIPVVAVRAVDERFHDPREHRRIAGLIPRCRNLELSITTKDYPRHLAAIIRAEALK